MEEERHNNPAGITFRKNPGMIETGVDGVEIIDDSQIPPEKLEKIGRNITKPCVLPHLKRCGLFWVLRFPKKSTQPLLQYKYCRFFLGLKN